MRDFPDPREPTCNCCTRIGRELVEKTTLIEQYLLPLLPHLEIPGGILADFRRRWRKASLAGKNPHALITIARRHGISLQTGMTDDDIRGAILDIEQPP
jgi:hypothetical protein